MQYYTAAENINISKPTYPFHIFAEKIRRVQCLRFGEFIANIVRSVNLLTYLLTKA